MFQAQEPANCVILIRNFSSKAAQLLFVLAVNAAVFQGLVPDVDMEFFLRVKDEHQKSLLAQAMFGFCDLARALFIQNEDAFAGFRDVASGQILSDKFIIGLLCGCGRANSQKGRYENQSE